jgi:hypothetical protein
MMPGSAYQDDPTIADSAELLRRIPPHHFVIDPKRPGGVRASSAAFDDDVAGPMSVYLADVLSGRGLNPESVLQGHPGYALTRFSAKAARECNQVIVRDPGPGDPAHALVCNAKPKRVQRALERASQWVVPPFSTLAAELVVAVRHLSSSEQTQAYSVVERLERCSEALRATIGTNANRRLDFPASSLLLNLESCHRSMILAVQRLRSDDAESACREIQRAEHLIRCILAPEAL